MLTIAIPHCKYTAVNNYISSSTGLKEILAEVFGARPSEVEDMILR
jgi:hypothetical protein